MRGGEIQICGNPRISVRVEANVNTVRSVNKVSVDFISKQSESRQSRLALRKSPYVTDDLGGANWRPINDNYASAILRCHRSLRHIEFGITWSLHKNIRTKSAHKFTRSRFIERDHLIYITTCLYDRHSGFKREYGPGGPFKAPYGIVRIYAHNKPISEFFRAAQQLYVTVVKQIEAAICKNSRHGQQSLKGQRGIIRNYRPCSCFSRGPHGSSLSRSFDLTVVVQSTWQPGREFFNRSLNSKFAAFRRLGSRNDSSE